MFVIVVLVVKHIQIHVIIMDVMTVVVGLFNKENKMTQEQLNRLDESNKISWRLLSRNPNAIELLKKKINKKKIIFPLSKNKIS